MPPLLAALFLLVGAHAGNARGNLFGAEAALSGGALVATTRAAEATWYNPAGLGGSDRTRLNVNLSAFVLRIRQSDSIIQTTIGDTELSTPADATQLVSVPSSISMVRRLSARTTLGLGVYVTGAERFNLLASGQDPIDEPWSDGVYTRSLQVLSETQQFHVGLSVGSAVSDRLRLGGSLMAVYDRFVVASSFLADLAGTEAGDRRRATLETANNESGNAIGLRGVAALQWEFAQDLHLGLVIRTPVLGIYRWGKVSTSLFATIDPAPADQPPTAFDYSDGRTDKLEAVQVDPMRISLSFGVTRPRFVLGIEGEVAFGVVEDATGYARRVHGNVALGGRFQVRDRVWLGAGLFTDMSPVDDVRIMHAGLDYYGLTFGPEFRNPVRARGRDDGVVFSTGVGVRYALGIGPFGALAFNGNAAMDEVNPGTQFTSSPEQVMFHEASLLIGSSVAF